MNVQYFKMFPLSKSQAAAKCSKREFDTMIGDGSVCRLLQIEARAGQCYDKIITRGSIQRDTCSGDTLRTDIA
jgi:hypothetical protein